MGYKGKEENRRIPTQMEVEVECTLAEEFDATLECCQKCLDFEGMCLMELALEGRKH